MPVFHCRVTCASDFFFLTLQFVKFFQQPNTAAPPPYPVQGNNAIPTKRFKPGEEPVQQQQRPQFYLTQQQLQMLHALQQTQNLTPQQQSILQQLTHKCQLMQQHQQQLRMQQAAQLRAGSAPVVRSGQSQPSQQFVQGQPGFQQQHPGNRTPQGGTTAQTGFVNDGNFSPATGNTQQTAGMPFKSAGGFQPQPITSTTNSQDLSKLTAKFASISLVDECFSMVRLTSIMLAEQSENTRSSQRVLLPEDTVELFTHFFLAYLF